MAFTEASHAGFTDEDKYELLEEINDKHFNVKFPLDKGNEFSKHNFSRYGLTLVTKLDQFY